MSKLERVRNTLKQKLQISIDFQANPPIAKTKKAKKIVEELSYRHSGMIEAYTNVLAVFDELEQSHILIKKEDLQRITEESAREVLSKGYVVVEKEKLRKLFADLDKELETRENRWYIDLEIVRKWLRKAKNELLCV